MKKKKEIENEIHITFSCNKNDNIPSNVINDINEVDNLNCNRK